MTSCDVSTNWRVFFFHRLDLLYLMSSQEDKCSLFVKMLLLLGSAAEFRLGRKQIPVMGKKMAGWDYQSCLFTDVCERV